MEWVETTGRTIEDAKEAALDQLGVDESDAEFEVVEEPRAGLFGRLRSEARVRARVRPTAPRAKDDRRDRRRRRARQRGGSRRAPGERRRRRTQHDHAPAAQSCSRGRRGGCRRSGAARSSRPVRWHLIQLGHRGRPAMPPPRPRPARRFRRIGAERHRAAAGAPGAAPRRRDRSTTGRSQRTPRPDGRATTWK